ncbi:MAG: WecB/TagA/CpsF family glycosyltransferase [Bacilli bacterium]
MRKVLPLDSIIFNALKISNFTKDELIKYIIDNIEYDNQITLFGYSLKAFRDKVEYPELINISNAFDVSVLDGRWLYFVLKLKKIKIKYFISIPQSVNLTLDIANKKGYSVVLFGSTEELNRKAILNLKTKYPNIVFLNGISGYNYDENIVVNTIKQIKPNILLIGLPTPQKEEFAYKYMNCNLSNVVIPCGGMINVFAGKEVLTPNWAKNMGLAVLFRLAQSPNKISRIKCICSYVKYTLRDILK